MGSYILDVCKSRKYNPFRAAMPMSYSDSALHAARSSEIVFSPIARKFGARTSRPAKSYKQALAFFKRRRQTFGMTKYTLYLYIVNKYRKHLEIHEKETKERQDGYEKKIAELEAENESFLQKLEEQEGKLRQAEARCRDQEKLKALYEKDAEKLSRDLKEAENEFGLNTGTTEF